MSESKLFCLLWNEMKRLSEEMLTLARSGEFEALETLQTKRAAVESKLSVLEMPIEEQNLVAETIKVVITLNEQLAEQCLEQQKQVKQKLLYSRASKRGLESYNNSQ